MDNDDQETRMIRRGQPNGLDLPPVPGADMPYEDDDATQAAFMPAPPQRRVSPPLSDLPTAHIPSAGTPIRPIRMNSGNEDQPTQFVKTPGATSCASNNSDKTMLVRPSSQGTPKENIVAPAATDKMDDPVVGWLVITEGPGKGNCICIGSGQNTLGRDQGNRIQCNFGDKTISRTRHISVSYDQRSKKFFVVPGDSSNMSYLNDNVILTPGELNAYDQIRLTGETVVTFIPFCGEQFSW